MIADTQAAAAYGSAANARASERPRATRRPAAGPAPGRVEGTRLVRAQAQGWHSFSQSVREPQSDRLLFGGGGGHLGGSQRRRRSEADFERPQCLQTGNF